MELTSNWLSQSDFIFISPLSAPSSDLSPSHELIYQDNDTKSMSDGKRDEERETRANHLSWCQSRIDHWTAVRYSLFPSTRDLLLSDCPVGSKRSTSTIASSLFRRSTRFVKQTRLLWRLLIFLYLSKVPISNRGQFPAPSNLVPLRSAKPPSHLLPQVHRVLLPHLDLSIVKSLAVLPGISVQTSARKSSTSPHFRLLRIHPRLPRLLQDLIFIPTQTLRLRLLLVLHLSIKILDEGLTLTSILIDLACMFVVMEICLNFFLSHVKKKVFTIIMRLNSYLKLLESPVPP